MLNFIILEDNNLHMKKTIDIINKLMMKNNFVYNIHIFESFNDDFKKKMNIMVGAKIFIIDYQLPEDINAIDVARYIRNFDLYSQIIVFTVHYQMALETFKKRLLIYDFIDKKYNAEFELSNSISSCIDRLSLQNNLNFSVGSSKYTIPYGQILYIYKDTFCRKSIIVTDTITISIPKSLSYLKKFLNDDFIYTHRACISNKKRIIAYKWSEKKFILDNGKIIYFLSNKFRKEIENATND